MNASNLEVTVRADGSHYNFGPFHLRPDGTLLRNGVSVRLPPKEFAALRLLLSNAGEIVSPVQLRSAIWGNTHVSADSLPRCISSLRALLDSENCIQTIYKRGYRFMLTVKESSPEPYTGPERRAVRPAVPPRLAILPFEALDGVPASFGPGIAEETMHCLARTRTPAAELMARDSVFVLAASGASAQEVGTALGADLALTGCISAFPRHFRIRMEMVRVTDAFQLWIEDFLVPRDQLAHADSRAARRISARIRKIFATVHSPITIAPHAPPTIVTPSSGIAREQARRSEAYVLYLHACAQWNSLQRRQMQEAMRYFQQALDLDPDLQEARNYLVHGYLAQSSYGYLRSDIAAELAYKQVEIAFSLSPAGQSLYPALGWIHFHHGRDLAAARDAFAHSQRASHGPSGLSQSASHRAVYNSWSLIYQVRYALAQANFAEAIALLQSGLLLDPYSPVLHARLAWAHHLAGDSDAAVEQAKLTQKLFPHHPGAAFFCSIVFAADDSSDGELVEEAISLASKLVKDIPSLDAGYANLAYAHARQGNVAEARDLLDRQHWLSQERFVMRSFHAPVLVELGELDSAMDALLIADMHHCSWLFELLLDPRLQPLHGEPEFERLRSLARAEVSEDTSVA
jgi:DNA-binding winged helix-turn-helix (wHTH) protein/tetratricopeptide (TPR) repeat protein